MPWLAPVTRQIFPAMFVVEMLMGRRVKTGKGRSPDARPNLGYGLPVERRILLAPAFALALIGCSLDEYGLPLFDGSATDGFLADGATSGDDSSILGDATTGSDGSVGEGGSTDGGVGDSSASDGPTSCGSGFSCGALGCMATCQGCPGSPLACATKGTCESDCTSCPSHGIECYLCDSGLPVGRCDTNSASECLGANYQHCSCAILPCLTLGQVCVNVPGQGINNECRTCGEDKTNGGGCGILQHCSQSAAICN